jgi:hypothetical protein
MWWLSVSFCIHFPICANKKYRQEQERTTDTAKCFVTDISVHEAYLLWQFSRETMNLVM